MRSPGSRGLKRGTVWNLLGHASRALVQMAFFLVLARALGPAELGRLGAALALVSVLVPFGLWGTGNLLIRDVARDSASLLPSFGRALTTWGLASGVFCLVGMLLLHGLLALSWSSGLMLAVADVACVRLVDLVSQAFQSLEDLRRMAVVQVVLYLTKLGAVVLFALVMSRPTAEGWIVGYFGASVVAALGALLWFRVLWGTPVLSPLPKAADLREGFHFSVGLLFMGGYGNLDKVILARFEPAAQVGEFAVASRVLQAALLPLTALLGSTLLPFFKSGRHGILGTFAFLKRIKRLPFFAAGACFVLALLAAAMLPLVFGNEYAPAARILLQLSPLVLFQALYYFMADALTGAGFQGLRSSLQGGAALANLLLCFWWIPRWGVKGAVAASLVTQFLLALGVGGALLRLVRQGRRPV